jgi:uncharacterized membrane protein
MSTDVFAITLLALAAASYACRVAGYLLMGHVAMTPRLEAALRQAPMGVMIGIVVPAATRGSTAELVGLVAVAVTACLWRNDLGAALVGVVAVALLRAQM